MTSPDPAEPSDAPPLQTLAPNFRPSLGAPFIQCPTPLRTVLAHRVLQANKISKGYVHFCHCEPAVIRPTSDSSNSAHQCILEIHLHAELPFVAHPIILRSLHCSLACTAKGSAMAAPSSRPVPVHWSFRTRKQRHSPTDSDALIVPEQRQNDRQCECFASKSTELDTGEPLGLSPSLQTSPVLIISTVKSERQLLQTGF